MAEGVGGGRPRSDLHRSLARGGALGDDHDREAAAALVAAAQVRAHLLDVERALGHEDRVGAARDPGVRGDPAGVAAHHLDDHHAVVRLRGGVQAVDRVGHDLHGGLEAERDVGAAEVVVDRLRHADDGDARFVQRAAPRRACPRRRSARARRRRGARASRGSPRRRPAPWRRGWCARCRGSCRRGGGCRRCCAGRARPRRRRAPPPSRGGSRGSVSPRGRPLRTAARITAFSPGQSPPPVSRPMRAIATG